MKSGYTKCLLGLMIAILGFATPVFAENTSMTDTAEADVDFTFEPYITVELSDEALFLGNLVPGTFGESAPIDIVVKTNSLQGYNMTATVGNDVCVTSELCFSGEVPADATPVNFTMVAADTTDDNLAEGYWGYRKSTGILASLPTKDNTGVVIKQVDSADVAINDTIPFSIAAKASSSQFAGFYENNINFVVVTNNPVVNE